MRGIHHKAVWNLRKLNLVWTCGSQYLSLFWQNCFKATLPYYTFTSLSSKLVSAFQALNNVDVDVIIIFPLAHVIHHAHHLVHPVAFDTRAFVGESISSHHRIFHQRMRDGTTQLWWICHQTFHLAMTGIWRLEEKDGNRRLGSAKQNLIAKSFFKLHHSRLVSDMSLVENLEKLWEIGRIQQDGQYFLLHEGDYKYLSVDVSKIDMLTIMFKRKQWESYPEMWRHAHSQHIHVSPEWYCGLELLIVVKRRPFRWKHALSVKMKRHLTNDMSLQQTSTTCKDQKCFIVKKDIKKPCVIGIISCLPSELLQSWKG